MKTPTPTLRPLVSSDQALLWEAFYLALWDAPDEPRRPRRILHKPEIACFAAGWGSQPDDAGLVAVIDDRPAGVVWSRLLRPPLGGSAFYDKHTPQVGIAVFPPYRGHHVGERLFEHHLDELRQRYRRVSLGVHKRNEVALAMYLHHGFKPFAEPDGHLAMVLSLDITSTVAD
ncbi:MAG: GNAT family N-acetyltransferase [Planctomycetota bacterium]